MWKPFFSVLIVLGPALAFGYWRMPTEMGLAIVGGAIAAAFINIDKIQRFKGAGFEAVMRKAVEEAYATTATLREIAKPLVQSTLHILTMANRIGGLDPHQKHAFRAELERLGRELRIDEDSGLRTAHERFFHYHTWDHSSRFTQGVYQINSIPEETRKKLGAMQNYDSLCYPSRDEIEAVLGDDIDKLEAKNREELEDYLHYCKRHTLRRPGALSRR